MTVRIPASVSEIVAELNNTSTFPSRTAMAAEWAKWTANGETPSIGANWTAGGLSYEYDGTTTAISDMQGWRPSNVIRPQHFGDTPNAAVKAAIAYANDNSVAKIVDARLYTSAVAITEDVFDGAEGVTLITGPVDWTFDADACQQTLYHDCTIEAHGTRFRPDQDDAEGQGSSTFGQGMFTNEVRTTTASITSASADITVASAADLRVGCAIAVQGLEGAITNQRTTLDGGIDASQTTITVDDTTGFDDAAVDVGAIQIDSEWITYTGKTGTTFTGCTRGAFGTTATTHTTGANVDMILDTLARVTEIDGTTVTLDLEASASASDVRVRIGAHRVSFKGKADMDGRRGAAGAGLALLNGIDLIVTSGAYVSPDWTFYEWNHSGVILRASLGFDINGAYERNGKLGISTGQDVFLFGQCRDGKVNTRYHRETRVGIFVDDRSSGGGDSIIGECKNLDVRQGVTQNTLVAMSVGGVRYSYFSSPYLHGTDECLIVHTSAGQWTTPLATENNIFMLGVVNGAQDAIRLGDGTTGIPALEDAGNVIIAQKVVNGRVNYTNAKGNTILIEDERNIKRGSTALTVRRQTDFSIAASTWATAYDQQGRFMTRGGYIYGYLPGLRVTADDEVVYETTDAARGDDGDGTRASIKMLPANIEANVSLKIEVKNHDAGGPRDYGWEFWFQKFS